MAILDDIQKQMITAMKAKDMATVSTLRMTVAEVKKKLIDQKADRADASDDLVIKTIRSMIKQRKDSIDAFEKAGRTELAEKEQAEINVLEKYLPAQLSPEQLEKLVLEAITETGAKEMKDMGTAVKAAMAKAAGQADGKLVSDMVRKKLTGN